MAGRFYIAFYERKTKVELFIEKKINIRVYTLTVSIDLGYKIHLWSVAFESEKHRCLHILF